MEAGEGEIYAKTGADGVFVASLPQAGLGIALKCDDGSGPAAEIMLAAALLRFLGPENAVNARLEHLARKVMRNWNGIEVGEMRPVSP
ncbi:MAG: asparaginase, partial [Oricola sp.]